MREYPLLDQVISRPRMKIFSIYGHNMRNGTMFADLLKYQSIEFWKMHPIIRLDTLWARYQYEIFYGIVCG